MDIDLSPHCTPSYRLLTEAQINAIHRATLEILETVGVRLFHRSARQMLESAGCRLKSDNIVQIPGRLVEDCIDSAPSRITIYDRTGREAMQLAGRRVYFGLGTDLLNTWDLTSGELKPSGLQDVVNAAIVGDYCQQIDFIASGAFPNEVSKNLAFIAEFRALAEHSVKPIYFTAAAHQDLRVILEMAEVIAGGRERLQQKPFLIHYAEPVSPLVHSEGAVAKLLLCADRQIPLNYSPAILSGGTGPVSLAGAIATANAEALSGLVIHQLRRRGAPMISGFSVTPLDLRVGTSVYGSPDEKLTHSACCDLYHHYGLPVWGEAGCSDSKCVDEQAALESAFSILTAAQDGCNLVHDIGYLGQGLIGSPAMIVMCDEMISYVRRIMRGFDMGPERMGIDVIRRVGPGGNFLAEDETLNFMREEHWIPKTINRDNPEIWQQKGAPRYADAIIQKTLDILAGHRPEPLPEPVSKALDNIYQHAGRQLQNLSLST